MHVQLCVTLPNCFSFHLLMAACGNPIFTSCKFKGKYKKPSGTRVILLDACSFSCLRRICRSEKGNYRRTIKFCAALDFWPHESQHDKIVLTCDWCRCISPLFLSIVVRIPPIPCQRDANCVMSEQLLNMWNSTLEQHWTHSAFRTFSFNDSMIGICMSRGPIQVEFLPFDSTRT